jgi:ABC-type Na+ efflux pump permease subunit
MIEPPSSVAAVSAIARVTLRRAMRGVLPRIAFAIAVLPIIAAAALHTNGSDVVNLLLLVLVILPPMFVASSLGEEIEDKTAAYLWSRPLARWTVIAGKLIALTPLCAAFIAASAIACGYAGDRAMPPPSIIVAVVAGAFATCALVTGIAAVFPRHAMIFAVIYLLLDNVLGALGVSVRYASIGFAIRTLAGQTDASAMAGVVAMLAIAGFWLAIAFRRIARLEV